jgi:hypothetical protein
MPNSRLIDSSDYDAVLVGKNGEQLLVAIRLYIKIQIISKIMVPQITNLKHVIIEFSIIM